MSPLAQNINIAPEIVNVNCAAPDRTEACGSFVFNPVRLYFTFARLYCLKFALSDTTTLTDRGSRDRIHSIQREIDAVRTRAPACPGSRRGGEGHPGQVGTGHGMTEDCPGIARAHPASSISGSGVSIPEI
jgi:hypothetical protein